LSTRDSIQEPEARSQLSGVNDSYQVAEKLFSTRRFHRSGWSRYGKQSSFAALKALRHPKSSTEAAFSAAC
jgi:hypothetical protein